MKAISALAVLLFASSSFATPVYDPNPAQIVLGAFESEVALKGFKPERFTIAIDCGRDDGADFNDFFHPIQLKVVKAKGKFSAKNATPHVYDVKAGSGLCSVQFATFITLNRMTYRADINVYGTVMSATELAKRDLARDITERINSSVIVGKKLKGWREFEFSVEHSPKPSDSFCVQVLQKKFANPNKSSIYATLEFGQMATMKKSIVGQLVGPNDANGIVYYTCDEAQRTLSIDAPDLDQSTGTYPPPVPYKIQKATFNSDLSVMSLNQGDWAQVN